MEIQSIEILPFALALAALTLNFGILQPASAAVFARTSPLSTASFQHTRTLLPNVEVLVAGAQASSISLPTNKTCPEGEIKIAT